MGQTGMPALEHITIKGFKSIASIEKLELRPINVVIGANGSGKSNFLGMFDFLHAICQGRLRDYVTAGGGAERMLHFGSKTTGRIEVRLFFRREGFPGGGLIYTLILATTEDDGLFPASELAYMSSSPLEVEVRPLETRRSGREAGISEPEGNTFAILVRDLLRMWRVNHLNDTSSSSPLRKTGKVDDNRFLRSDGSNLASFLYYLRARHEASYHSIVQEVRRVAPFFDDFALEPLRLQPTDIKLEWRHKQSDQYFDASSLSDGTLRFIALATLFLQPEMHRPSVILVDEPELGLHPYAMGVLAALVRQASETSQVILSTQSPTLLDYFEPADVLVAELVEDATTLKRLDPERLAKWLEDYSLGQLWEKNEIGGRPVPA
jgi:predicted ATPase